MIDALTRAPTPSDLDQLAQLLADAVDSGASVSFMRPFSVDSAREWWRTTLERADPRAIVLVARDDLGIVGSVSLHPAWPPNQPHRADIKKLLVHRSVRGHGVGAALMAQVEEEARRRGRWLLVLDTVPGENGHRLYLRAGWTQTGLVPNYALFPDGRLCDTAIMWKRLER